jgi:hypothetical protein
MLLPNLGGEEDKILIVNIFVTKYTVDSAGIAALGVRRNSYMPNDFFIL